MVNLVFNPVRAERRRAMGGPGSRGRTGVRAASKAAGTGVVYEATLREEGSVKRVRSSIRGGLQGCVPRALTLRRIAGGCAHRPIGVARPLCEVADESKEITRGGGIGRRPSWTDWNARS